MADATCLDGGGEMGALMRATDWAATPLGPVAGWPASLATSAGICLGSAAPMLVCWGPELCLLYNDAYRPFLGRDKHPGALGQPLAAIEPDLAPVVLGVLDGSAVSAGRVHYGPIRDEAGAVAGVLGLVTDEGASSLGEQLARLLAHELRNPLSAVVTSAQMLVLRNLDETVAKPARRILSSGQRMGRMLDQLLDFTRLRRGIPIAIHPRETDLGPLVERVAREVAESYRGRSVEVSARGDLRGTWDEERVEQLVIALAGNAFEHGTADAVTVAVDGDDARVTITIENAGAVAEEAAKHLFEPFLGALEGGAHKKGLGLGLFVAREVVRAHGGELELTSAEGRTRVTFTLPR
jgi:signal transduction histidine kinase